MAPSANNGCLRDGKLRFLRHRRPLRSPLAGNSFSCRLDLSCSTFKWSATKAPTVPAAFKSSLRISTPEGGSATGQCWMNHPFSFPGEWWRTWTGLTYKISQASWNPDNLSQSTVQVLRDPGWLFKWIGSLLIVAGVFMMFYLRPYRRQTVGRPILPGPEDANYPP